MFVAVWAGKTDCVRFLIGAGVDLTPKDKYGKTALGWAKSQGHAACVALLEDPDKVRREAAAAEKKPATHDAAVDPDVEDDE